MTLVHIQPVYAQLLKGDHIVLLSLIQEFVEPGLQGLSGFLHLLDGKVLPVTVFQLTDGFRDLIDLFPEKPFLPLCGNRDLLKLRVSDDHSVIIAGGDPGTELLPVFGLKITLAGYQQLGTGIEPQEFIRPLECQMVRHHKERFL